MKSNIDDDFELENLRLAALKSMKNKNDEKNKIQPTVSDRNNERDFKKNKKSFNKPNHSHFKNIQPSKFHFNQPRSNLIVLTSENEVESNNSNERKNSIKNKSNKFQKYQKNYKINDIKEENKHDSLPTRFSRIEKDSTDEDEESDSDDEVIEKYRQTYFDCNEEEPIVENNLNSSPKEESNQDELKIQNLITVEKDSFEEDLDINLKQSCEKKFSEVEQDKYKDEQVIDEKKENNDKMVLRNKKRIYEQEKDFYSKKSNENDETKKKKSNENDETKRKKSNDEEKNNSKEKRKIIFSKDDSIKVSSKQKFLNDITDKNSKKIDKNDRNNRIQILNKSNIVKLISTKNEDIDMKPNYKTNHENSLKKMRSLVVKK